MKAEPSPLIPRKPVENLLVIWKAVKDKNVRPGRHYVKEMSISLNTCKTRNSRHDEHKSTKQ